MTGGPSRADGRAAEALSTAARAQRQRSRKLHDGDVTSPRESLPQRHGRGIQTRIQARLGGAVRRASASGLAPRHFTHSSSRPHRLRNVFPAKCEALTLQAL